MNTEALVGGDKEYPAPEFKVIVADLPVRPIFFIVNVTVAELAPAGIVN